MERYVLAHQVRAAWRLLRNGARSESVTNA